MLMKKHGMVHQTGTDSVINGYSGNDLIGYISNVGGAMGIATLMPTDTSHNGGNYNDFVS